VGARVREGEVACDGGERVRGEEAAEVEAEPSRTVHAPEN